MMPVYRYMDSDPYQRNQTFSFPQPHYSGLRANSPRPFEPWPYGGNYSYPIPCHSCCSHNSVPGFRPSHPHASMLSPVYFYGGYPAPYHEAYPVHYVPPPPHYSMEIPKYEYDKNMPPSFHCCGCPNHACHQNMDKGVKIEEQGPDVEKKAHDSLVPVQLKNYPYPIVWIPPESMNGGEQRKLSEPETIDEKKIPCNSKPHESLKSQEGDQRHGWFPFDLNNIGSLMQGGNWGQVQDQQKQMEDKNKEFPFPIFWVPSYEEIGRRKGCE
ncbi:BAG family molecular chaperone regulator 6 [Prunus yedoensis var. nudiflora]|uniref:BAG family molecular chaperone regulator 6 n=1 Tax=Prunus yedoensis var. nudiflora TaxID=2094558 RepID=A0A314YN69_PRUYE|nr:BAG family molecular chaperone regulator 6 [Prunus yedoensis var. nudiflora]